MQAKRILVKSLTVTETIENMMIKNADMILKIICIFC